MQLFIVVTVLGLLNHEHSSFTRIPCNSNKGQLVGYLFFVLHKICLSFQIEGHKSISCLNIITNLNEFDYLCYGEIIFLRYIFLIMTVSMGHVMMYLTFINSNCQGIALLST